MPTISAYAMVYKTSGGETLLTVPVLRNDAGDKYPAGFTGHEPADNLTTSAGRTYPDPLADVWHLVPIAARRRVRKLHYTDAPIWIRIPDAVIPAVIRNAQLRHGL